ncbi:hypothetical protein ACWGB8_01605 [Kitasatospora sp. NPDC054939]
MTLHEHCPTCLAEAGCAGQDDDGARVTAWWRCPRCGRGWTTQYLSSAYGDQDELEDGDGAW